DRSESFAQVAPDRAVAKPRGFSGTRIAWGIESLKLDGVSSEAPSPFSAPRADRGSNKTNPISQQYQGFSLLIRLRWAGLVVVERTGKGPVAGVVRPGRHSRCTNRLSR